MEEAKPDEPTSRIGKLIHRYPAFLSSFVLGVAGLIATSMWQCRQSASQRSQAEAQQKVAETQAQNSWKIERTEVLGKNLNILAQSGPGTADQRYGVLLSLTRAEIIDPELAVSYALELGKDNTEYMVSVLATTPAKDYVRIARAYSLSCEEKYGVSPAIEACNDKLAPRSRALGDLVAEELTAPTDQGPMVLLKDERRAQHDVQRLAGLFETALLAMYDRRGWDDIDKFAKFSPGAHLVSALVLSAAHTGEFVPDDEAKTLAQFHATQTKWLTDYLVSNACDAECKGRLLEVMVTHYQEAQGDFDTALGKLLEGPRAQSGVAISRLHARLLWCEVDDTDLVPLRDHVLVPVAHEVLTASKVDPNTRESVLSLIALVPEPTEPEALTAWNNVVGLIEKADGKLSAFKQRRATAAHQRLTPPPSMRRISFCSLPATPPATPPPAASPPPASTTTLQAPF